MAKDSYWFRHDSTAGRGLRMRKMAHIHGHWGKGIYWDVIEILRDQSNYCFDYDDSSLQMLCDLIGCKNEAGFITFMRDCVQLDLFQIKKGKFFSVVLCENMQFWEKQKVNGGKTSGNKEPKPKHTQSHTQGIPKPEPEHNIIVQYSTEDNIIEYIKQNNISFGDCFLKWMSFRKTKKKPISFEAAKKQLAFLKENEKDCAKIIDQSIMNDWQGLFELKSNHTQSNGQQGKDRVSKDFSKPL